MAAKRRKSPQINITLPPRLLAWLDGHRDPNDPRPTGRGHRAATIVRLISEAMARELANRP
jgi:hypothetical protein